MDSTTGNDAGRRRRNVEPDDARGGFVTLPAGGLAEAAADREMADAERSVVMGTASAEQRSRVHTIGEARTHEDRRTQWMDSAPAAGADTVPGEAAAPATRRSSTSGRR